MSDDNEKIVEGASYVGQYPIPSYENRYCCKPHTFCFYDCDGNLLKTVLKTDVKQSYCPKDYLDPTSPLPKVYKYQVMYFSDVIIEYEKSSSMSDRQKGNHIMFFDINLDTIHSNLYDGSIPPTDEDLEQYRSKVDLSSAKYAEYDQYERKLEGDTCSIM